MDTVQHHATNGHEVSQSIENAKTELATLQSEYDLSLQKDYIFEVRKKILMRMRAIEMEIKILESQGDSQSTLS